MNALSVNNNKRDFFSILALAILMVAGMALAGTDSTFTTASTTMTNWLTGSMGKLFAIGALAIGLGVGLAKQSVMAVAVGVGVALAASVGPAVLSGIFSAVL